MSGLRLRCVRGEERSSSSFVEEGVCSVRAGEVSKGCGVKPLGRQLYRTSTALTKTGRQSTALVPPVQRDFEKKYYSVHSKVIDSIDCSSPGSAEILSRQGLHIKSTGFIVEGRPRGVKAGDKVPPAMALPTSAPSAQVDGAAITSTDPLAPTPTARVTRLSMARAHNQAGACTAPARAERFTSDVTHEHESQCGEDEEVDEEHDSQAEETSLLAACQSSKLCKNCPANGACDYLPSIVQSQAIDKENNGSFHAAQAAVNGYHSLLSDDRGDDNDDDSAPPLCYIHTKMAAARIGLKSNSLLAMHRAIIQTAVDSTFAFMNWKRTNSKLTMAGSAQSVELPPSSHISSNPTAVSQTRNRARLGIVSTHKTCEVFDMEDLASIRRILGFKPHSDHTALVDFEENGFCIVLGLMQSFLQKVRTMLDQEFSLFRWHNRNLDSVSSGLLDITVHSVSQQILAQHPLLYFLQVLLRPDHANHLVSLPTGVRYHYKGINAYESSHYNQIESGFLEYPIEDLKAGICESCIRLAICYADEMGYDCEEILPRLHKDELSNQ
ncbi:unnamed protein product [Cercospora beticola]|nr:unnamed protein product [Cercospora beticola]